MEAGLRKEGKASKIMTLIKNSELTGGCGERLVQCSDPNKEIRAASEQDSLCCAHPESPADLRTEVCPLSPASSGGVTVNSKETQPPVADGNKDLLEVEGEEEEEEEKNCSSSAGVSGASAQSRLDTSEASS